MAEERKLKFGSGYKRDRSKTKEENWEAMREYYRKKDGRDIGDYPVFAEEEKKLVEEVVKNLKPMRPKNMPAP